MVDHILAHWVAAIDEDLVHFPLPTMDVLQKIRQRMVETRDALLRL